MRYFGPSDQIHLSVTGTRHILGQINDKVKIVSDFAKSVLFYAKIVLSTEERVTVSFYSSYHHDHDINYSIAQEIQPSTARER